jgi:phosphatidylserine decarboxylase
MRFARDAWPFVIPFVFLSAVLAAVGRRLGAALAGVLGIATLLFFRDPERRAGGGPDLLVAPADGLITRIDEVEAPSVGPGRYRRVVTFLSVFDVHIQRVPTDGEVVSSVLTRGPKLAAFAKEADKNEAHEVVIERHHDGDRIAVRQLVGLIARRIVCWLDRGERVIRGQHLGLIKFGSRVDLIVPLDYEILVAKGDRVRGGETPMARARPAR